MMQPFLFALLCLGCVLSVSGAKRAKPNIVLILTDDQDITLGGWTPMKQTQKLVSEEGLTAENWFIHTPVCCPSRGELFSGRYFHSIHKSKGKRCMNMDYEFANNNSFGSILQRDQDYILGYYGKQMNTVDGPPPLGYDCPECGWFANGGGSDKEPGAYLNATFQHWEGGLPHPVDQYHADEGVYKANTNGEHSGYTTSIIANYSIAWLQQAAASNKPFHLTLAPKAPHIPATPAPWYEHKYRDRSAPRTPAYNASKEQLANHHHLIANQDIITLEEGEEIDDLFRDRWRALLSVDDAIAGVVATLEELGVLDNTYIFITSDHGYNLGQHRLPSCKLNVYDHDIRIPLVIMGPGVPKNKTFTFTGSNSDLAPTFVDIAGLDSTTYGFDGKSILNNFVTTPPDWRDFHYVEYYTLGDVNRTDHLIDEASSNTYRALRFMKGSKYGDFLYSEFTTALDFAFTNVTFYEAFDVSKDKDQLNNIYHTLSHHEKLDLKTRVQTEFECEGQNCA